jgi:8-oxo-dGTP diphosphatase
VTAHLAVTVPGGRLLILRSATDHTRWQLPGGIAEEHEYESPPAAAERETREETALHLKAGILLVVAWTAAPRPGRRDRLAFLFAGPTSPTPTCT